MAGAVIYAPTDTQYPDASDWGNGTYVLDAGTRIETLRHKAAGWEALQSIAARRLML